MSLMTFCSGAVTSTPHFPLLKAGVGVPVTNLILLHPPGYSPYKPNFTNNFTAKTKNKANN